MRRHVRLVRRRGRGQPHRTSPLACAEFRRGTATRPSRSSGPRTYIVASPQKLSTERSIDGPTTSLLLRGGLIVTQDSGPRVVSGAGLVEEGRIASVGSSDLSAGEVIDCTGCAVVPGLINLHNHVPNTLLRGVADDVPLEEMLPKAAAIDAKLTRRDVQVGALLGCVEMIRSGTTSFHDLVSWEEE